MTSGRAQERKSALIVGVVFFALAAGNAYRGRESGVWAFGLMGAVLVVVGLFVPPAARAFHVVWMRLAHALGWVNSRILLAVLFYLVLTPMGLVQRLFRRDALLRRGTASESYWMLRESPKQSKAEFERLF